jgi:hypothetical protein
VNALNGLGRIAPFEAATFLFGYLWVSGGSSGCAARTPRHGPSLLPGPAHGGLLPAAACPAATQLDKLPSFQQSRWVWMATLVAAIYKGLSAQWLVAAFGLSALWKLVAQYRDTSTIQSPQEVAFVALAAWAFYKQVWRGGTSCVCVIMVMFCAD